METDPIMERREQEAKLAKVKSLKTVMYVLAGVAVGSCAHIYLEPKIIIDKRT